MAFGLQPSPAGYGSTITIEETGPSGPGLQPRRITLVGPSLPFMGAEWGFMNQLVTDWYPGNSVEATQQVLGPRELPSAWEGEWKRTMMGRQPTMVRDENGAESRVVDPFILRTIMEDVARAGVRLRVTWSVTGQESVGTTQAGTTPSRNADGSVRIARITAVDNRPINIQMVREGRVSTFRTPIDRHSDIRWAIEFQWMSRGGRQDRTASTRTDDKADVAATSLQASIEATMDATKTAVTSANKDIRKSASRFTLGQLENLAAAPQTLVTNLTRQLQIGVSNFNRLGDIAKVAGSQPLAVQQQLIDFSRSVKSASNNFQDALGRRPAETNTNKMRVAALLRAQNTFAGVAQRAAQNARQAAQLEAAQRDAIVSGQNRGALTVKESATTRAGLIIAVHVTKSGETPQTVSLRYYGTPDQAVAILRANRLPYHQPSFRPGTILVVPQVANVPVRAGA